MTFNEALDANPQVHAMCEWMAASYAFDGETSSRRRMKRAAAIHRREKRYWAADMFDLAVIILDEVVP